MTPEIKKPAIFRRLFKCRECDSMRTMRGRGYRWNPSVNVGYFICRRCERLRREVIKKRRSKIV